MPSKVVLTYGTFDLFHVGHLRLLNRLKALGDYLVVGVSSDEFNALKNKKTIIPFQDRLEIVSNIKSVDAVIREDSWGQKEADIREFNVSVLGMGHDWQGKFDFLSSFCQVVYLPRTPDISSTDLKRSMQMFNKSHVGELKNALDVMSSIVDRLS